MLVSLRLGRLRAFWHPRHPAHFPHAPHGFERRSELALGIDHEVGAHHHLLPFLHAVAYLDVALAALAEMHLTWLEVAVTRRNKDGLPRPGVEDGVVRHDELLAERRGNLRRRKHLRLQPQTGIVQLDAHLVRARFTIE